MKESITDTEDSTAHKDESSIEAKQKERMLVIDGGSESHIPNFSNEATPTLSMAAEEGNLETVKMLLEHGAEIDATDSEGQTALHKTSMKGHRAVLRILMKYDPKVNFVDNDGNTALHCINSETCVGIVKILDVGGADLDIRNKGQDTPLCKAVWFNNLRIVKYLANEAELDIRGRKHGGPLHIACYKSNLPLVKILVNAGANVDRRDPVLGTPLQATCLCEGSSKEEQESTIFYLINEAKVDIEIKGGSYGCAVNVACGRSSEKVMEQMLDRGANSEVKDVMGRMAIHFAAARSIDSFFAILESGANVDWADKMGRTALHWAAIGGMKSVVHEIMWLLRGLVDQGDRDGWSPLLWAARGSDTEQRTVLPDEQEEVIELLLDRGADPCVRAKGLDQEWSPVKVAKYHGVSGKVIRLLEDKAKEKLMATGGEDAWDNEFHASRKAAKKSSWCACCFSVSIMLTISPRSLASAQSLFRSLH